MKKANLDINEIVIAYEKEHNLHKLANMFHTSHIRISNLLKDNGIEIQGIGKKKNVSEDMVSCMVNDYVNCHLTIDAISKKYSIRIKRVSKILKENNINISKWNGHIKKEKPIKVKKEKTNKEKLICPICGWKTYDINGKAHSFQKHLCFSHGYDENSIDSYIENYPEHEIFVKDLKNRQKMIKCKECGKWLSIIDDRHLKKHNMTKVDYIMKYDDGEVISHSCKEKLRENLKKMIDNPNWKRFTSSYETEISDFLSSNGIKHELHNRSVLNGKEIDILCGNIGIEFDGCLQHTEWFGGKTRLYHLSKTEKAKENGVGLIHIFEDEFVYKKEIVFSKLKHLFNINDKNKKIYARKCIIKEISGFEAETFLNKNHIQGYAKASVYLGAFYDDSIIGVMTFKRLKKDSSEWDLNRFATDIRYKCCGVGGKLFSYFIKAYSPSYVKSFADRRWTINYENNVYTKIGFKFDGFVEPTYWYYSKNDNKPQRFHKFGFRKNTLLSKYKESECINEYMSETEMAKALGYDRIWDCGLIKYVWKNDKATGDL